MFSLFGRSIIQHALALIDFFGLLVTACLNVFAVFRHGWRPTFVVFLRQIYFTGIEALKVIVVLSFIVGSVIITQIINVLGTENGALTGRVLVWTIIRELGPLLTAIIVIARSGTAIATELGAMKINGEIANLETMGIDPRHYLITPRVFGVTVAVVVLTLYFEIISVVGGSLLANIGWHLSFGQFYEGIFTSLTLRDLFFSVIKSVCFGLSMSAACSMQGLAVGRSATEIPQAATRGVMMSLFLVFAADGVLTFLSLW
jgi:phospholipid/cholesterol/gamma-HCH transport system permease protein